VKFLIIGLGGFVGANLRYLLQLGATALWGLRFPYGTLIINVTGSFALGFFLALLAERTALSPNWRYLVAVGLLGGYTTFSSFTVETLGLLESGRWASGLGYAGASVILALLAAFAGTLLGRAL
jgi:CrcB protein